MQRRTFVRLSSLCLAAATGLLTGAAAFAQSGATNGPAFLVDDIFPGREGSLNDQIDPIGGYLTFRARYNDNSPEQQRMYVVGDPKAGAIPLKDRFPGGLSAFAGGVYYSIQETPEYGRELYRVEADGSTTLLKDVNPGIDDGVTLYTNRSYLRAFQNKLYFLAREATDAPVKLWSSDGTVAGTVKVSDVPLGDIGNPSSLNVFNDDTLVFNDTSIEGKIGWWVLHNGKLTNPYTVDGTPGDGPNVVAATDTHLIALETLPYNQETGLTERVVWSYARDGSGRVRIGSFTTIPLEGTVLSEFVRAGNKVFFAAYDYSRKGSVLFVTDGTADSLQVVADRAIVQTNLTVLNNAVFFFRPVPGAFDHDELWRTDGTAAGTFVIPVAPQETYKQNFRVQAVGGKLLLSFNTSSIWTSDGTVANTRELVANIRLRAGTSLSFDHVFAEVGDYVYFRADTDETGRELWAMPLSAFGGVATPLPAAPTPTPVTPTPQPPVAPSQKVLLPLVIR